jgi:hypothetical protein
LGRPHFFNPDSFQKYFISQRPINSGSKLFALFVGCHTPDRAQMVQDVYSYYLEYFFISIMRNTLPNLVWPSHIWNLGSVDNLTVQDQYRSKINSNLSLLAFYDQFQIELVAESITRGPSFFPTEKTVRPIIGGRPFMTFAPKNFLKNLRQMGFRTFDTVWSEEYDSLEGPDRWVAIQHNIRLIIRNGYDCKLAQDIVNYNYQHLGKVNIHG